MMVDDGDGALAQALGALRDRERAEARRDAATLLPRLEFLTWDDRASLLGEFFWGKARLLLDHETVTSVINRRPCERPAAAAVASYAARCRGAVTAVLAGLREPPPRLDGTAAAAAEAAGTGAEVAAALTYQLSLLAEHREPAAAWLGGAPRQAVARELAHRPGYAFLTLTLSPNDSAESFLARDAFFAAMLGRA